tara:strand:+ start:3 stop:1457 length:1455 start_codon:yes stop_codon:yes gene_type:complete
MGNSGIDLVSIIIPFFNEDQYFDGCINSILKQTYTNYEIIIVDDGSEKKFKDKLEKYKNLYPNLIKLITHKVNKGVSSARNTGISEAKGEYIAFIDSDDEWMPNKLEHQIKIIKQNKLDFIHGSYFILDENENFNGLLKAKNMNYKRLLKSCDIGLSTVIMKASLCKKYKFSEISTKEDYILWLQISKDVPILFGDEHVVCVYRNKKNSLSKSLTKKFVNAFIVFRKYEKQNLIKTIFSVIRLSYFWVIKEKKSIGKNIYPLDIIYIRNINKISYKKSFILVALNMASLAYIKLFYLNLKKMIFWMDGYSCKSVIKEFTKLPGREVIEKVYPPKGLKNIYLCGNRSEKQINYIKKLFNKEVILKEVPFFKTHKNIIEYKINFDDESIIIINISTPKQEILAQSILKQNQNKKLYIFCLGGGIAMACGEEEIVPNIIDDLNLEWFWRLKTNTWFRLKRLIYTSSIFFTKRISLFYKKFSFKEFVD